jgi:methyl-accepting chemotaxis protein
MSAIRDLGISRKFFYTFGVVCLLCALQGLIAIMGFLWINSAVRNIAHEIMPSMRTLGHINSSLSTIRRSDSLMLLCPTSACVQHYSDKRQEAIATYNTEIDKYAPTATLPGERETYEVIRNNFAAYINFSDRGYALLAAGKHDEAAKLLFDPESLRVYNVVVSAVEKNIALNDALGTTAGEQTLKRGGVELVAICVLLAVTVGLCALIGTLLTRLIVPPLQAVTVALEQFANKDLTISVEAIGNDEIGRLSAALNSCSSSIKAVLEMLSRSASTLSTATEELNAHSDQAKNNAEAESSKTNQIAAAAQEMTATIGEISHNSETASNASRESASAATKGGTAMQGASATMEQIATTTNSVAEKMDSLSHRSEEIGRVVTVIQEISEQTNLLALNAAIEAARAGENGRGFAVVAGEVRRLAERTKGATEEIAASIQNIQVETRETRKVMESSRDEVKAGMTATAQVRKSLEDTITAANNVEEMIHLIATATTEQAAASGEIAESASQISKLSGLNSRATEEASSACKNLSLLTNELNSVIQQFRID